MPGDCPLFYVDNNHLSSAHKFQHLAPIQGASSNPRPARRRAGQGSQIATSSTVAALQVAVKTDAARPHASR